MNHFSGVYLCKHADMTTPAATVAHNEDILIIFQTLKGKMKLVGVGSPELDPDYNYDCHVANLVRPPVGKLNRLQLYRSNLVCIYS